jgi:hypothetical protein
MRTMRWLPFVLWLFISCATAPKPPPSDAVAGQLVVGTAEGVQPAALEQLLAIEGYRVTFVSSAGETTHLVEVKRADGTALTAEETEALLPRLTEREGVRYVEPNRVRQPR